MADKEKNLYYLDDLSGYKVDSDYSDVRGWDLYDSTGRSIGKIDGLLANKATERVVYLDVEVGEELKKEPHDTYQVPANEGAHEFINKEGENHLIIPVGMVDIDDANKKVIARNLDYKTFASARRFSAGIDISPDYEQNMLRHYTTEKSLGSATDDDFYGRPEFENPWRRNANNKNFKRSDC
jgi:hypothetical protein